MMETCEIYLRPLYLTIECASTLIQLVYDPVVKITSNNETNNKNKMLKAKSVSTSVEEKKLQDNIDDKKIQPTFAIILLQIILCVLSTGLPFLALYLVPQIKTLTIYYMMYTLIPTLNIIFVNLCFDKQTKIYKKYSENNVKNNYYVFFLMIVLILIPLYSYKTDENHSNVNNWNEELSLLLGFCLFFLTIIVILLNGILNIKYKKNTTIVSGMSSMFFLLLTIANLLPFFQSTQQYHQRQQYKNIDSETILNQVNSIPNIGKEIPLPTSVKNSVTSNTMKEYFNFEFIEIKSNPMFQTIYNSFRIRVFIFIHASIMFEKYVIKYSKMHDRNSLKMVTIYIRRQIMCILINILFGYDRNCILFLICCTALFYLTQFSTSSSTLQNYQEKKTSLPEQSQLQRNKKIKKNQ